MNRDIFLAGIICGLSLLAADESIMGRDTSIKWRTDSALLEFIPQALRARIQADEGSEGTFSTLVKNNGKRYMQVQMGAYEYAIVRPVCLNGGAPLCSLYSGYNTVLLPNNAMGDFSFGIKAFKENSSKTGPWFDFESLWLTDAPTNAPIIQLAANEDVATVGSKLNVRLVTEAPVAGDVKVRFFVGPSFINYRFNNDKAIVLKHQNRNVYEASFKVDKHALSFSSKENPDLFIMAMAEIHNKNCYFKLPFQIDVKTKNRMDLDAAPLGELYVRDERELWEQRVKGDNIAHGVKCDITPLPSYHLTTDDNDCMDLTDGNLTSRIDDKLWWDKGCIGWLEGSGHSYIRLDFGKVQPLGKAVIRLLGGTTGNFKFPATISAHVSKDGKYYYTTASIQKLAPCESGQCDWKRYYYLNEERSVPNTRVYPFELPLNADGRYLIIEIEGETGAIFSDELAVIKAEGKTSGYNNAYGGKGKELPMEGLVIRPRVPEIAVIAGLPAPQALQITDMRVGRPKNAPAGSMVLEFPKGVKIINDNEFKSEELPDGGMRYVLELKGRFNAGQTVQSPVFFLSADKTASGSVTIYGISDGVPQLKSTVPLKVVELPPFEPFKRMHVSLSWMGEDLGRAWPDFWSNWRRLGFNTVSTFPRYWQSEAAVRNGGKYVDDAHKEGYKVIMNESCFHVMTKGKKAGDEMFCQIPGSPNTWLCPTYRGEAYQRELERVANCVRISRPDYVFYDIEIWHNAHKSAPLCSRCRPLLENSGKSLDDFLYDMGTETVKDLKEAVGKGAEAAGIPMPIVASYNRHAAKPKYAIEDWNRLYPQYLDIAEPSLYVCGRAQDVHDCIRKNREIMGGKMIIPWLTAGTYGEFDSCKIEQMVLEALMNGAMGVTYFQAKDFYDSPLDFYYHAKALAELRPYENLLMGGKPLHVVGDNKEMTYSMIQNDREFLLLVGNYKSAKPKVKLTLPFVPESILDVRSGKNCRPSGRKFTFEVPKNDVRLFHIISKGRLYTCG